MLQSTSVRPAPQSVSAFEAVGIEGLTSRGANSGSHPGCIDCDHGRVQRFAGVPSRADEGRAARLRRRCRARSGCRRGPAATTVDGERQLTLRDVARGPRIVPTAAKAPNRTVSRTSPTTFVHSYEGYATFVHWRDRNRRSSLPGRPVGKRKNHGDRAGPAPPGNIGGAPGKPQPRFSRGKAESDSGLPASRIRDRTPTNHDRVP
jgi:hypothetical protein